MSKNILKINSVKESIEIINIIDIIIDYNPVIKDYFFTIPYFDAIPNDNFEGSFMDFSDEIDNNSELLFFNSAQLKKHLLGISQIFDLLILIDRSKKWLRKYSIDEEKVMYENVYITIAYFDGGFWEISSKDEDLLNFIKTKYPNC